jgi:hypothetical protein
MKAYGAWRYSSTFLDLSTRCSWVVGFKPRPFHPRGKSPRYPLDLRLGGPQSRSGRRGKEKNRFPAGNWTLAVQPFARHYTDWAILTSKRKRYLVLYYGWWKKKAKVVWMYWYSYPKNDMHTVYWIRDQNKFRCCIFVLGIWVNKLLSYVVGTIWKSQMKI